VRMSFSRSTLLALSCLMVAFDDAVDEDERATVLIASMRVSSVPDIFVRESQDEDDFLSILIAINAAAVGLPSR
jgi:hypothetical protein